MISGAPTHARIVALGSAGDVHPFVGIGCAFRDRGHAVTLYASPVFQRLIERCGLGFRAVGTEAAYHSAMADPALWQPRTSLNRLWQTIAAELRPLFDRLAGDIDGRSVLLGSLWAFSARLIHEKFDVPYLSVQVSPSTLLSAHAPPFHPRFSLPDALPVMARRGLLRVMEHTVLDRTFGPELNRLRRDIGLAPVQRILSRWVHAPQGVLGLFPSWFARQQPDWPQPFTACGFPLYDAAEFDELDDELLGFLRAGPQPVVVTPGSTSLQGPAFFAVAVRALQQSGRRGVLLGADALAIPNLPASLIARRYVPLSRLLPHGCALLHHGGIGTAALALAAGTPQLVTPFAHDQFDNAVRLQRLGVALSPRPGSHAMDADELTRLLHQLTSSERIHTECKRRQHQVEPADAARLYVAHALERLSVLARPPHPAPALAHVTL